MNLRGSPLSGFVLRVARVCALTAGVTASVTTGLAAAALPDVAAAQAGDDVSVRLVSQTRLVRGDEDARIVLRLARTGLPDPPRTRDDASPRSVDQRAAVSPYEVVVVALAPTLDRDAVRAAVEAAASGAPLTDVVDAVRIPYEDVRVRDDDLVLRVPVELTGGSADELMLPFPVIYPLVVTVTRDGAPLASLQTFVERLPDGRRTPDVSRTGSLAVAIVGQVDGPPSLLSTSATRTDRATVDEIRRVTAVLQRLPDVPITLSLRPEVIEGLDRSSEISDRTLASELASAVGTRELLASTYVRVDPSSLVAAGLTDVYTTQLRRGEDVLARAFPQAPTVRTTGLVTDPLTGDGAELARNLGARSLLVLPVAQSGLGGGTAAFADPLLSLGLTLPSGGDLPVTFIDPTVADALSRTTDEPLLEAHRIMADLSAWVQEINGRGETLTGRTLVLTRPDGSLPDAALLEALTSLIGNDPRFTLRPLGQAALTTGSMLADGAPVTIEPAPTPGTDEADLAYSLGVTRSEVAAVGSMLPDGDLRVSRWDDRLDIAPSSHLDTTARSSYIDSVLAETGALRASVAAPPETTFTLGGRSGDITLSLGNDADVPLTVVVRLTSAKLLFPEGAQTAVLAPGETTIIRVPVEARSNNTFPVTVELLTPEGLTPIGPPVQLTARVTAFTGLGQLATGAGAIILATWWVRHWRRNKRRRLAEQLERAPGQHPAAGRRSDTATS